MTGPRVGLGDNARASNVSQPLIGVTLSGIIAGQKTTSSHASPPHGLAAWSVDRVFAAMGPQDLIAT